MDRFNVLSIVLERSHIWNVGFQYKSPFHEFMENYVKRFAKSYPHECPHRIGHNLRSCTKNHFGRQVSNHVSLGSKIFGQISMVSLSQPGVPT